MMQIEPSAQLTGIARILREVVGPEVADPYVADVLQGAAAALDILAAGLPEQAVFLRWDAEASSHLLRAVGVEPAAPPSEPAGPDTVERWHRDVRAQLEEAVPLVRADATVSAAAAAHFRERCQRYPYSVETMRDAVRPGSAARGSTASQLPTASGGERPAATSPAPDPSR